MTSITPTRCCHPHVPSVGVLGVEGEGGRAVELEVLGERRDEFGPVLSEGVGKGYFWDYDA